MSVQFNTKEGMRTGKMEPGEGEKWGVREIKEEEEIEEDRVDVLS